MHSNYPDLELLPHFNAIQVNRIVVDSITVQITEPNHSCIDTKVPLYDESTCTYTPSHVKFVNDDSSVDSLSSTGNATLVNLVTVIMDQKLFYQKMSPWLQYVPQTR